MMHLAPKVFLARIDSRAVVLDLARDRYLALSPRLADAARDLTASPAKATLSDPAPAKLLAEGLVSTQPRSDWDRCAEVLPGPATETLWPSNTGGVTGPSPIRPSAFLAVQRALTEVALSLRFRTFQDTITWLSRQPCAPQGLRRPIQTLLDEFSASRPWFPVKPICRLEALSIGLYLRRNGCPASVVFGVKLEPFAAHCWAQVGATVLNEPHDEVCRFSPILAA